MQSGSFNRQQVIRSGGTLAPAAHIFHPAVRLPGTAIKEKCSTFIFVLFIIHQNQTAPCGSNKLRL
jgi:hypothetical protein